MIVEFFGPPAVGKTTLAKSLAAYLQQAGYTVKLITSDRPADREGFVAAGFRLPAMQRIVGPAAAVGAITYEMLQRSPEADAVVRVLKLLPAHGLLFRLRFRQYLLRLLLAWRAAALRPGLTIFDQGCVQAACSLAVQVDVFDHERLCRVLQTLPVADLLIRVDAPRERVQAKLLRRRQQQGFLERRMEREIEDSLRFIPVGNALDAVCRSLRRNVLLVDLSDEYASHACMAQIVMAITAVEQTQPSLESL